MAISLPIPILLAALPKLNDPNFVRAVILLIEYNENGALGFVLNRPTTMPVQDVIVDNALEIPRTVPAWIGGPVGTHTGLVLHRDHFEDQRPICEGLSLSSSQLALEALARFAQKSGSAGGGEDSLLYPFRFLIGHAGWGPFQLDSEIKQGAWVEVPFSQELVFKTPWQELWNRSLITAGVDPATFVDCVPEYLN